MNNPLTDIIPARARKYVYALFGLAGVIVGALNVADVDTGKASDVLAYLGVALALTAASNTKPEVDEHERAALAAGVKAYAEFRGDPVSRNAGRPVTRNDIRVPGQPDKDEFGWTVRKPAEPPQG